ncbi:MAG: protein kinase [Anaerolineae bacterium]|nr:protein kinase [Anaerolineae bacterium]
MNRLDGVVLKGYEFRQQIGAGGFGAVYRAYQTSIGREVAVKMILPQFSNRPDFVRRFEVEAQVIARLEHPHIVPLYDYWRDPEGAYLVMRWLPGNLRRSVEGGPWKLVAIARLLDQMASALSIAHRDSIVHRDIKPDNILLDEDENAYLADFGIAKDMHLRDSPPDNFDTLTDSPAYWSPEQIRSELVTSRTDIYSLGYVIYELVTGVKAFPEATTPAEYMQKHLTTPLPMVSVGKRMIPAAVDEVLQTATAKDPSHRYPTALRFAAAFRAAIPLVLPNVSAQPLADPLTGRELEVLKLMIDDLPVGVIAERLFLTLGTVRWYVKQIYSKLDVNSRQQAVERALNLKLHELSSALARVQPAPDESVTALTELYLLGSEPENPYKGLRAFQESDTGEFFGRASLTERLLSRLSENGDAARFLVVVGPSGSGKSSIVRAGLIPALRKGALASSPCPFIADFLPGAYPMEELEAALLRVSVNPLPDLLAQLSEDRRGLVRATKRLLPADSKTELILVIDQFEEVFTLVEDEAVRVHFIDNLLSAVTDLRSRVRVIVTLRADFYDRPLMYPRLAELVRTNSEVIVPLMAREIEQVIAAPVERSGMRLEAGLVATIINDVGEQPGTLPLLEYALTELFEHREGMMLTLEGYRAIGGVSGALGKRADHIYHSFDNHSQELARQLFLRLITPGEGTEDTRRRTPLAELIELDAEGRMEDVINAYANYRLLTLDHDLVTRGSTAEIAHEAVIREWARLREWLLHSREDIRIQHRLAQTAAEWNAEGDVSFLASGSRLTQFEVWAAETTLALTSEERSFLDASFAERGRRDRLEQEHKAHEQQLERRSQNILRVLVVILLLATLGAFGLTGAAVTESERAEANAELAQANYQRAEAQRLAAEANGLLLENGSAAAAALLAIRSLNIQYTSQGDEALIAAALQAYPVQAFVGHTDRVKAVDYSPDGRTVLTGSGDSTVRLWDVATGQELQQFSGDMQDINSAVFSPDGRTVLTGSRNDHTVRLWDIESGEEIRRFTEGNGAAFSLDGERIFLFSEDTLSSVMIDLETGEVLHTIPGSQRWRRPETTGYSPDGSYFVDVPLDGEQLAIRDVETGEEILSISVTSTFENFAFSQDNRYFAVNGEGAALDIWDLTTREFLYSLPGEEEIISIAFSPDGQLIAAGDGSNDVYVWDVQTGQQRHLFRGHTLGIRFVDFSPDGRFLLSGGFDQIALLWELAPSSRLTSFDAENYDISYLRLSPDGRLMAAIRSDGTTLLWDLNAGDLLYTLQAGIDPILFAEFTEYGDALVTMSDMVRVWNVNDGSLRFELPELTGGRGLDSSINWLDVTLDYLIASYGNAIGSPGDIVVWSLISGEEIRRYATAAGVTAAVMSPDGRYILSQMNTDRIFRVLDASTGDELFQFHGVNNLSAGDFNIFSRDGRYVFTGGNVYSDLHELSTGELIHQFAGHRNFVSAAAFSREGQLIVTSSTDNTIRFWELASGQEIRRITLPFDPYQIDFLADDETLAVLGNDGKIYFLRTGVQGTIDALCSRLLRDFNVDEREQYEIEDEAPTCPA